MYIKPVKSTKLYEVVIDYIMEMINNGEIKPGEKLYTENEFMKMFKVSKSVLREAFRVLENRGIIETRPGDGRYMRLLTVGVERDRDYYQKYKESAIIDIYECRQIIEVNIVRLAAMRATSDDIDALDKINREMKLMISDTRETDLDMEFHLAISKAAHNIILFESMQNIINTLKDINEKYILPHQECRTLCAEHQDIFEAIASRDENRAVYAMRNHLMHFRDMIGETLT
ncbi:FadR/GntR family transcriptional regulator [Calorimonas adulescens]|jgi:Bacterial regulatory proteins, gntR family./FCD domain.|uniref:FadR family transcriptional regulator n=1 Tax=Calorimonas adulescens TaxID=2606906 RepID=A0A5D8QEC9_9THEO|nr:FadR/GntR family transcriptional regulator [Calorimonas adulescens]TZE82757.1 FadR family transcriptional regulator [Calorimonas adulescens]